MKESALTTIHKSKNQNEIKDSWKYKILKAKHSPIRELTISYKIDNIPRWIADQLVRHNVGINSYMGTGRPDRNNKPRNEQTMEELTCLMQTVNGDSFINMCNQRMCIGCASKETRELVEKIVLKIKEFDPAIAFFCVPNCILYGACKENDFVDCGHYKRFIKTVLINHDYDVSKVVPMMMDIRLRYQSYHNFKNNLI